MRRTLLTAALLAASLGSPAAVLAAGDTIVITTGKEGGGYHGIGKRLAEVLGEGDQPVEVLTSVGSLQNLNRLAAADHPAGVGLTQADALKYFINANPDFADRLMILGDMGNECVFIITGADSDIDDDGDLQKKSGNLISVQSPDSGVAVTWEYMTQLEPKFLNTAPSFTDTMEALLQIKAGSAREGLKAAMLVQKPTARSPAMEVVLENPKDFRFIPVTDWDLNDKLPDGSAVYSFEEVTVEEKRWGFDKSVDTICTRALLVAARDKLDADQRSRLARVILLAGSRLVGEP